MHTSLRKAAGLIKFVQDTLIPQLVEKAAHGSDLDIRVISGMFLKKYQTYTSQVSTLNT